MGHSFTMASGTTTGTATIGPGTTQTVASHTTVAASTTTTNGSDNPPQILTNTTSQSLGKRFHNIIRLDPFTGDIDTSFTYWLNKYENFCDLNGISEQDRLSTLPFYLTKSALIYYNELPPQITSHYSAMEDSLRERFGSDSRYIDFSILSAKQETSDSVEYYLNRICKLASDKSIPERLLISICLNGLKPSLRKSVLLSQPKHFSELTRLARLAETSEKGLMNSIETSYEFLIDEIKI